MAALIGMDTGNVVENTRVDFLGWMTDYQGMDVKRKDYLRLFNR